MDTHIERIGLFQHQLETQGIGAALLLYSRDVFYYTGTAQPAYLFILPDDYILFVRSGYDFARKEISIDKEKLREERRLEKIYAHVSPALKGKRIATELDILPANEFLAIRKIFSGCDFVDASPMILEQRKTKDVSEIQKIKEACEAVHMGHEAVLSTLREGITELELSAAVENAHRLAGHEGIFFIRQNDFFMSRGPISSGPNLFKPSGVVYTITGVGLSPSVPAGPSRRKIVKGDTIMVDIPVLVNGYHADQTRTYVLGKATKELKFLHVALKEIADDIVQKSRPGMPYRDIFRMATEKAEQLGVRDAFLNFGSGRRSRLVGHGVGLELNEPPVIAPHEDSMVSKGHVIALDIHMLQENVGVVKLEDMVLIRGEGNEILTRTPRELFEID